MKRRGFTLTELVIVIALSAIILLSVTSMITFIQSYSRSRDVNIAANNEVSLVETGLRGWFAGYDSADSPDPNVSPDGKTLSIGSIGENGENSACFQDGALQLNGGRTVVCSAVTDIVFAIDGANPNLVKCSIFYTSDKEHTVCFLLLKKSVNR